MFGLFLLIGFGLFAWQMYKTRVLVDSLLWGAGGFFGSMIVALFLRLIIKLLPLAIVIGLGYAVYKYLIAPKREEKSDQWDGKF